MADGRGWGVGQRGGPRLLERCAEMLDDLGVLADGEPFDLERFRHRFAERLGRPIHLTPIRIPAATATMCGAYIRGPRADHAYYADSLSPLHRTHNAVHELAHGIWEHRLFAPLALQSADPLLVAMSSQYSRRAEVEAEAMATVALSTGVQDGVPAQLIRRSMMWEGAARLTEAWR